MRLLLTTTLEVSCCLDQLGLSSSENEFAGWLTSQRQSGFIVTSFSWKSCWDCQAFSSCSFLSAICRLSESLTSSARELLPRLFFRYLPAQQLWLGCSVSMVASMQEPAHLNSKPVAAGVDRALICQSINLLHSFKQFFYHHYKLLQLAKSATSYIRSHCRDQKTAFQATE